VFTNNNKIVRILCWVYCADDANLCLINLYNRLKMLCGCKYWMYIWEFDLSLVKVDMGEGLVWVVYPHLNKTVNPP